MRTAVKLQGNIVYLVRQWQNDETIDSINTVEVGDTWMEVFQEAQLGWRYDAERDVFVPPDWVLVDGVWTAPAPEPLPET
jgi:hypothetical protein